MGKEKISVWIPGDQLRLDHPVLLQAEKIRVSVFRISIFRISIRGSR